MFHMGKLLFFSCFWHILRASRLHDAILAGDVVAVQSFDQELVNFEELSPEGRTPLLMAVQTGNVSMVQALFKAGVNYRFSSFYGEPPLVAAAERNLNQVFDLLVENGANVVEAITRACVRGSFQAVKWIVEKVPDLVKNDINNPTLMYMDKTPLFAAAYDSTGDIARIMIKLGADPESLDINGCSAIAAAAEEGNVQMTEVLEEANVDITSPRVYCGHSSIMHAAILHDLLPYATYLLDKGIDIDVTDAFGRTPFILASALHLTDAMEYLFERGADIWKPARDLSSTSPFTFAFIPEKGSSAIISLPHLRVVEKRRLMMKLRRKRTEASVLLARMGAISAASNCLKSLVQIVLEDDYQNLDKGMLLVALVNAGIPIPKEWAAKALATIVGQHRNVVESWQSFEVYARGLMEIMTSEEDIAYWNVCPIENAIKGYELNDLQALYIVAKRNYENTFKITLATPDYKGKLLEKLWSIFDKRNIEKTYLSTIPHDFMMNFWTTELRPLSILKVQKRANAMEALGVVRKTSFDMDYGTPVEAVEPFLADLMEALDLTTNRLL